MRFSEAFIPTQKEVPKDAVTPSHIFLLRGGYVRMIGAGIYEMLPLGQRVLGKISTIIRQEMDDAGSQEILMPAFLPATYFQETGRYDSFGDALFRLKDRKGQEYHLGPTHEEIITDMVRRDVSSYKQLPFSLYQVQMKYRDEPRPRAGLLRCREFLMKDAYSFDVDHDAAVKSYERMRAAYEKIFTRVGLEFRVVSADSGAMGGSQSAEFQVLAKTGEDAIVACQSCDYAANVEVAVCKLPDANAKAKPAAEMEKVATPKVKTIEDVVDFFDDVNIDESIKSLLFSADGEVIMAVVRGDHQLNEVKLARALGVAEVEMVDESIAQEKVGAPFGSLGPVGFEGRIIVDEEAARIQYAVCGANEAEFHLRGVLFGRDYHGERASIRQVEEGDACSLCGETLREYRGIEGGHIFVLGTHYSEKMKATFLNEQGKAKPLVMGCYGIGVSRMMAAAIEQYNDDNGIIWPMAIAPYHAVIIPVGKDDEVNNVATTLYDELKAAGVEVILDDRKERPGVKFNDADLIGFPLRITVGSRGLKEGKVELKLRAEADAADIEVGEIAGRVIDAVSTAGITLRARG